MAQNENPDRGGAAPVAFLHERAMDNLSFIRDAMARSAPLTAVSGWGTIIMGCVALVGAYVGSLRRSNDWWIWIWLPHPPWLRATKVPAPIRWTFPIPPPCMRSVPRLPPTLAELMAR